MAMKKMLIAALLMCCYAISYGQTKEIKELEIAVEQLRKALLDGDKVALQKITSEDLSYGHSSGKIETKSEFINTLTTGVSDFLEIELKQQTIQVNKDVALVRHELHGRTQDKGKEPATIKIGVLLVWIKRNGTWQLYGRQAFKLP
jgi:ketosteroid isomerase-like protein